MLVVRAVGTGKLVKINLLFGDEVKRVELAGGKQVGLLFPVLAGVEVEEEAITGEGVVGVEGAPGHVIILFLPALLPKHIYRIICHPLSPFKLIDSPLVQCP